MRGKVECAAIGVCVNEPRFQYARGGELPLLNFTVVVGDDDDKQFLSCAVFGDNAEHLKTWLDKGKKIYVEGQARLRLWNNAEGEQRASLDLACWKAEPIGAIGRNKVKPQNRPETGPTPEPQAPLDREPYPLNDEIPF